MQKKQKTIKPLTHDKAAERKLSQFLTQMVDLMSRLWRQKALGSLQQKTIEKFEDAKQVGNFASIFNAIAKNANKDLIKRFSDRRIELAIKQIIDKVNKRNGDVFAKQVEEKIGINAKRFAMTEGLNATSNAFMVETQNWVKKLRDDTLSEYTNVSLRAMAMGETIDDIFKRFDGMVEERKNHSKMVARTQISTYNSLMNKARAQKAGITEAMWVTGGDGRVRKSHAARDGKTFELSNGLYSSIDQKWLLPGTDYQCRCTYEMIIPED